MPVQLIRRVRTSQPQTPIRFAPNVISAGLATTMFYVDLVTGRTNIELGGTKGASSAGVVSSQPRARIRLNRGCSTGYTLVAVIDTGGVANDNYLGMDDASSNRYFQFRSGAAGGASLQFIGFDTGASSYSCTAPAASSSGIHVVVGTLANGKIQAWSGNIGGKAGTDGSVSITSPKLPAAGFDMWVGSRNNVSNFFTGKCAAYVLLDGGITESKARDFIVNPWQLFGTETIPLFWTGVTAQSATASIAAAIRSDRTASASLSAAIQSAATASATLSGAIQTAQSATSGLTAYVVASGARSSSASLSAAISDARTATSILSAAVATARTATATLDSAIQIEATASTGASAAIREAFSLSANIGGAVQASATTSASLAAVVATTNAISSGLSAAVRAEQAAFATLSAYIAADVVLTQAEVDMLTDIWQRFGLDPLAPLAETEAAASFGGIVLSKSGTNTITSTRSGDSAAGIASSMILDVWQRLGLDPDNPMTASETQISAGTLSQARAVSGATVTVTRAP